MDSYDFDVRLTPEARRMLRPGEALVLDWRRLAICYAGAREASLYAASEERLRGRRGLVRLKGEDPIFDLPKDFGLRAAMGRLSEGMVC
jgi:hypothetical protein